ncbi:putative soyasaponin III rhamnosyltransferase [Medicago truncatula]|uniref:Putative soyasaponin III rhamnosyltransferase n=1 Tax=Medicago truncatula TaxID=3880 RepID=G7KID3_MEDTR|nr:soyasaponin III rhamnosyltransferase [Medicago truncatula]AES75342.1 UDP-glucosyltransferase family protein [Medicago truncatula]QJD08096.1 UDP-glucuronosyl/UDP-glucosyltransferase [Medicago truncatula]RHN51279.1 putative soyasaponin III rhamnosyltransferase [Medicago truncatula]
MASIVNHENENKNVKSLHVVMVPWLAMGHILPFFELAKILAQNGHTVTFINSPKNIDQMPKTPKTLQPFIKLVKSPLPYIEELQGAESTQNVPLNLTGYLKLAYDGFQDRVTEIFKTSKPDWVFCDLVSDWLPSIAKSFNIPCAYYSIGAARNLVFFNPPGERTDIDLYSPPKWVPFQTTIHLKRYEVMRIQSAVKNDYGRKFSRSDADKLYASVDLFLFRTSRELEGEWLDYISDQYKVPVVPVGLLPPPMQIRDDEEDEKNPEWVKIKAWLDSKESSSIVYIGFGSESKLSQQDITELAHGIELSRLPFFWALKDLKEGVLELPKGFEERTKERGIVWKTWVPQFKILTHGSIGGCMTHCGPSSVFEMLYLGHVLVTLPYLLDQCLFARVLEEKKVAVEVPRSEPDGAINRDCVAKTLRLVIVDEEGSIYRNNAKEMGKVVSSKDLHNEYIKNFIATLQKFRVHSDN